MEGKDLSTLTDKELRETRTHIAMIFQHFNLLMQRTVIDNICFPLEIIKVPRKDALARARELLEIVGLTEKELAYPAQPPIPGFCFVMRQPALLILPLPRQF